MSPIPEPASGYIDMRKIESLDPSGDALIPRKPANRASPTWAELILARSDLTYRARPVVERVQLSLPAVRVDEPFEWLEPLSGREVLRIDGFLTRNECIDVGNAIHAALGGSGWNPEIIERPGVGTLTVNPDVVVYGPHFEISYLDIKARPTGHVEGGDPGPRLPLSAEAARVASIAKRVLAERSYGPDPDGKANAFRLVLPQVRVTFEPVAPVQDGVPDTFVLRIRGDKQKLKPRDGFHLLEALVRAGAPATRRDRLHGGQEGDAFAYDTYGLRGGVDLSFDPEAGEIKIFGFDTPKSLPDLYDKCFRKLLFGPLDPWPPA